MQTHTRCSSSTITSTSNFHLLYKEEREKIEHTTRQRDKAREDRERSRDIERGDVVLKQRHKSAVFFICSWNYLRVEINSGSTKCGFEHIFIPLHLLTAFSLVHATLHADEEQDERVKWKIRMIGSSIVIDIFVHDLSFLSTVGRCWCVDENDEREVFVVK